MPNALRWVLAISILVVLLAIFIITFILYKKTPAPKGCEEFEKPSKNKCSGCGVKECHFNLYYNDAEEQAKAEFLQEQKDALEIQRQVNSNELEEESNL